MKRIKLLIIVLVSLFIMKIGMHSFLRLLGVFYDPEWSNDPDAMFMGHPIYIREVISNFFLIMVVIVLGLLIWNILLIIQKRKEE